MGVRAALTITMASVISGPFDEIQIQIGSIPAWNVRCLLSVMLHHRACHASAGRLGRERRGA
jgi:hypothetical protein